MRKIVTVFILLSIVLLGSCTRAATKEATEPKKLQYIKTTGWEGYWQLNNGIKIYKNQSIRISLNQGKYALESIDDNGIQKGEAVEVSKNQLNGWLEKDGRIEITRYSPLDYQPQDYSAIEILFLDWPEQLSIGPYAIIKKK
jgi:hypothetical protein